MLRETIRRRRDRRGAHPRAACAVALATLALLAGAAGSAATETPAARRVVAIGDVHGELPNLQAILRHAGLMAGDGEWSGGDATLVMTGDLLDRGPAVAEVMDLLMALQESAAERGGEVVVLTGNHESMNLLRSLRDVGREAFDTFADAQSEARREAAFRQWQRWLEVQTERLGTAPREIAPADREAWLAAHPPGRLEYQEALGPAGRYGRWLRSLPLTARVERTLLLHAGLAERYARVERAELERRHAASVALFDEAWGQMVEAGVILPFFTRPQAFATLELYAGRSPELPPLPEAVEAAWSRGRRAFAEIDWLFQSDSPLWYRGFATLADEELRELLGVLRQTHDVDRVVAGHTVSRTGRVQARLEGQLFLIDTGMLTGVYGGRPAALEIVAPAVAALYLDRRDPLAPVEATEGSAAEGAARPETKAETKGYPVPRRVWHDPDGHPLPFQSPEEATAFLRTARIVSSELTSIGITQPRKVLLEKDGLRAHAVVHHVDVEKKHVTLSDGSFAMRFLDSFRAQIAAYEVSRLLGMETVPPTVARRVYGKPASVQLWIEHVVDETKRSGERLTVGPPAYVRHQAADRAIFHNLVGNIDANQGNILWDGEGNIWLVDHTRTLAANPTLPRPELVTRCSRRLLAALRDLDPAAVEARLRPHLGRGEIQALLARRELLLQLLAERIERLGEEQVLFDYGDGEGRVIVRSEEAA